MDNCERSTKNSDDFQFKYIPKSSLELVIQRFEDTKKSSKKEVKWDQFYTVSSEFDDTELNKACYEVEPRDKAMSLEDVYNVLKSSNPLLPSEAAPLFGPAKNLRNRNRRRDSFDNQPSNRNQTTQQASSTRLKNLQFNKIEESSSNSSIHIVEVVNVADVRGSDERSKIQVTEQITPNDNVNDEKSGIIECSSDNDDETLYSEILDLCNEIEISNEDDGSSVSHHGNEMKKIQSSGKSTKVTEKNKKAKNISKKLICEPIKTTSIYDEVDFLDDDEAMREFEGNQSKGGLRTEFYDMRPETPYECEYPVKENDKIKTESYVSKAETPMEYNYNQVSMTKRQQMKSTKAKQPVKSERLDRPPTRYGRSHYESKKEPPKVNKPERPDSRGSSKSLEDLTSQVVKRVDDYQERICKYLGRIYDIICEPHQVDDIHDYQIRHRRSVEFTNLFVRNHLYQIGRSAESIRGMSGNPIDIVAKVNSLFQLILQGVQTYLKNLEGFIFNNSPDKLLVLTEYIVNAVKVCFDRRACSIQDKGIMEMLKIIDEIRYCLNNCDRHGNLLPSFYEEMERKKQQKIMGDGNFEEHQLANSHSMINEQGDGHKSRIESRQGILKDSRDNSRDSHKNLLKSTSEASSIHQEKFKTLNDDDFNENRHKKLRSNQENCHSDYSHPADKIWNNEAESRMIRSRQSYVNPYLSAQKQKEAPKNIYGCTAISPYDLPINPYGVPKMKAKRRVAPNRSNLSSTRSSAVGSRLNSSKSSVHNQGLHPTKSEYFAPSSRALKGNAVPHHNQGANLQSSKSMVQKPNLHSTRNAAVNGLTKNAFNSSKLQSSKSTVHSIKKSTSDVSTILQKEIENGQLSDIEEEDYDSDHQSEVASKKSVEHNDKKSSKCGSEKHLRFDSGTNSRCSSRSSMKSTAKSENSEWSSDDSSKKSDKNFSKNKKKLKKIDNKSAKNSKKADKSSSKIDHTETKNDNTTSKFSDLLQSQNDPCQLMKLIQNLTKEKFDALMDPIKAQLVPKENAKRSKAMEPKKSVHRVKADVKPLKKPGSADSQRSIVQHLASNVQLMLVDDDNEDDSDEVEVEMPKAKASPKPSSMTKKSEDKNSVESESSEEDDKNYDVDFSKFTDDELRKMAIEARQVHLDKIKNNPLYFNNAIEKPWELFTQIADQIAEDLFESVVMEMMTETNDEEKKILEDLIKSEVEC